MRSSIYNIIDFEKIKKFKEIFDKIYREIFNEKIDKGDKKVIDFMNRLKLEISQILKTFSLKEVEEYREIIKLKILIWLIIADFLKNKNNA